MANEIFDNSKLSYLKKGIQKNSLFTSIVMCISIFYGRNSVLDIIITTIWILGGILSLRSDYFYDLIGALFIFQSIIYFYGNIVSMITVFLLLYIIRISINSKEIKKLVLKDVTVSAIVIIYTLLVLTRYIKSSTVIISLILSMIVLGLLSNIFGRSNDKYSHFFHGILGASVCAGLYGLVNNNSMYFKASETGNILTRSLGVKSDPNYMGCIYIIALCGVPIIKSRTVRGFLYLSLIYFLFSTSSLTGIIVLTVYCLNRVLLIKRRSRRNIIVIVIILIFILFITNINNIGNYYIKNISSNSLNAKIAEEYLNWNQDNRQQVGSGRLQVWIEYMQYYCSQSILKVLLGGNISNSYGVEKSFIKNGQFLAAHNTYIDMLMSVGMIGTIIIIAIIISSIKRSIIRFEKNNSVIDLIKTTSKVSLLVYLFTLSTFPSLFEMLILIL